MAIVALILGYTYLKGVNIVKDDRTYYATFSELSGLEAEKKVWLSGHEVGRVEQVNMSQFGSDSISFKVGFTVDNAVKLPIDSRIVISPSLLGSTVLKIRLGASQEFAESGHVFSGELELDIEEQVQQELAPITESVTSLVRNVDSVVQRLQFVFDASFDQEVSENMQSIEAAIFNIRNITQRVDNLLARQTDHIDTIVTNVQAVTQTLEGQRDNIDQTLTNIRSITDSLAAGELTQTLNDLSFTVDELSKVVQKLNDPDNSAGALLNDRELYDEMTRAIKSLDSLVTDIQENPGRYVKIEIF